MQRPTILEQNNFPLPLTWLTEATRLASRPETKTDERATIPALSPKQHHLAPPSIRLTNPSNGDFYQCGEVYAQGTYEPGSSELESIMVSIERFETDGEGSSGYVPVETCPANTSGTNFTSSCNIIRDWGGDYRLRATIRTSGGQASDTLSYTLGDCS